MLVQNGRASLVADRGQSLHQRMRKAIPELTTGCTQRCMRIRYEALPSANPSESPWLDHPALVLHMVPGKLACVPSLLKMLHWHPIAFGVKSNALVASPVPQAASATFAFSERLQDSFLPLDLCTCYSFSLKFASSHFLQAWLLLNFPFFTVTLDRSSLIFFLSINTPPPSLVSSPKHNLSFHGT